MRTVCLNQSCSLGCDDPTIDRPDCQFVKPAIHVDKTTVELQPIHSPIPLSDASTQEIRALLGNQYLERVEIEVSNPYTIIVRARGESLSPGPKRPLQPEIRHAVEIHRDIKRILNPRETPKKTPEGIILPGNGPITTLPKARLRS